MITTGPAGETSGFQTKSPGLNSRERGAISRPLVKLAAEAIGAVSPRHKLTTQQIGIFGSGATRLIVTLLG